VCRVVGRWSLVVSCRRAYVVDDVGDGRTHGVLDGILDDTAQHIQDEVDEPAAIAAAVSVTESWWSGLPR
jgi:hypothetical protein